LPLSSRGESSPQLSYLWMLRRLWASGEALRGWNPLVLGGQPTAVARVYHLHLALAGLSYLLNISPEWMLKAVQFAATLFSAWGAYAFARRLGSTPTAALLTGMVFALFPARIALTVESIFVTCAWAGLPWIYEAYERTRDPTVNLRRAALLLGLAWAWLALTGTQWFLLLLIPFAFYVILREGATWLAARREGARLGPIVGRLVYTGLLAGLALVGLTLFYYWPSLREANLLWSSRYIEAYPASSRWSISWRVLLDILLRRWQPGFAPFEWDLARIFPNMSWYLGLSVCVLAVVGLARLRQWAQTVPLLGLLALSMLLVTGPSVPYNPAYFVVRRIPFVSDSVRNAFRYLWPASFALAALAGLGLDRLLAPYTSFRLRPTAFRSMLALAVTMVVLALVLLDFWPMTTSYGTVDRYFDPQVQHAYAWLDSSEADSGALSQAEATAARYWAPFQVERPGLHYTDTSYGVRYTARASINDDEYHTPSAPYRAALLFGEALRGEIERPEGLSDRAQAILDLADVRYVLIHLWPDGYRQATERLVQCGKWRLVQSGDKGALDGVAILENLQARPFLQAYSAAMGDAVVEDERLLTLLPQVIERGYAIVEWPSGEADRVLQESASFHPLADADLASLPPAPASDARCELLQRTSTEVRIAYQAETPFLLMVSQTWYPQWQVTVDGSARPLLRLNGNFQGIYLAAGEGEVIVRYRLPRYIQLGYVVSAATVLVMLLALVWRTKEG
jgi:hypothetical protein